MRAGSLRTVALVQGRMSSQRLPGKILMPLGGRPVLGVLLDRLRRAVTLDGVVVTTSTDVSDDPVEAFCAGDGIACFRGSLDDVAGRMVAAATTGGADVVVRISGDSPLLDPVVVDLVVGRFLDEPCDLATNVFPRSWPAGQSVEVLASATLAGAWARMTTARDREHVTTWFYDRASQHRIVNVALDPPATDVRTVIDTPEDAVALDRLLVDLEGQWPAAGVREIVATLRATGVTGPPAT